METIYIGFMMAIIFLVICMSQIFYLQKEVRKLNKITSFLLKEVKKIQSKNG